MDKWAAWLLERRHGGDEASLRETLEILAPFGARERGARVVFSDVSQDLLDACRQIAAGDDRCSFVRASATDLSVISDESVDVVTTRSVLIYVSERARAFTEFFRVLRPGGRLSRSPTSPRR